jgi:hypothetical protein
MKVVCAQLFALRYFFCIHVDYLVNDKLINNNNKWPARVTNILANIIVSNIILWEKRLSYEYFEKNEKFGYDRGSQTRGCKPFEGRQICKKGP